MADEKTLLNFIVGFERTADYEPIKAAIEALSSDIKFKNKYTFGGIRCETSKETYEKVFNAKLSYKTHTVNELVGRPQQIGDWHEDKKAVIPESLKDIIDYIEPEHTAFPC